MQVQTEEFQLDMEEIAPDIYRIRVPSPKAFGELNSYLLKGEDGSALIDVGLYNPDLKPLFDTALDRAGVLWNEVSILATHAHADHLGGIEYLWNKGMPLYSSMDNLVEQRKRIKTRFENFLPAFKAFKKKVPDLGPVFPEEVEAALYSPCVEAPIHTVHDGDVIRIGDFQLEVIETPGHDFCEICFWEPKNRFMFSGDHVIESIVPSIYVESFDDELSDFIASLEKISHYDAKLILPGHGHEFTNIEASTQKIIDHHTKRVELTYELVASGVDECISIAYALLKQPRRIPWEKRSTTAQWKAVCETIGYLNHLEHCQRVKRIPHKESFLYYPVQQDCDS